MVQNLLVSAVFVFSAMTYGQTLPRPEFEVTSVKPHKADPRDTGPQFNKCAGGRLVATNSGAKMMIEWAWDAMNPFEAPAWASFGGDTYDIEAKAGRAISLSECKQMLQSLLADRFQLKVHKETREQKAFALVQAKGGAKLKAANMDNPGPEDGIWIVDGKIGARGWEAEKIAWWLTTVSSVGLPVVDKTGLNGFFQFRIDFTNFPQNVHDKPDIFQALQQQLGLRLEAQKLPIETFVIDHIEKPSAN